MNGMKAQASVELLVLLGIATFVLTMAVLIASSQITDVNRIKEQSDAKNAVYDLDSAAKEVYAQGEGAKKQVYIVVPASYQPNSSRVGNRTILLKAMDTDYVAVEEFDVHGTLPGASGAQWVWVISEGNKVRIGNAMLSLSQNSIYVIIDRNQTKHASLSIKNVWDRAISVNYTVHWPSTDVSLSVSPSGSFALNPQGSQAIDVGFIANGNATGYQNGIITFTASDGQGNNETVNVPVTVEVVAYAFLDQPPLKVIPNSWAQSMSPNTTKSKNFSVCTNSATSVSGVTFTSSSGAPGSWVGGTSAMGPIGAGNCSQKTLSISVPNGTANGLYQGSVLLTGTGVLGANATISLYISVEDFTCTFNYDNQSMCNCPVGANYWDVPMCNCVPATVYVMNGTVYGGPDNGKPYNGTLRGGGGDIIAGTNVSDIIVTSGGGDIGCGNEGDDFLYGGNSPDMLDGGPGNDVLYGGNGPDRLYGKAGNDMIYGEAGADDIDGGTGDDQLYGGEQSDVIYGGPGNDLIDGGNNDDTICGNSDNDNILGGSGKDIIDGGGGVNTVNGGDGTDDCYRSQNATNCESTPGGRYSICGPS